MRLWLKIFLWFWLATSFVAAAFALSFFLTRPENPRWFGREHDRPFESRWRGFAARSIRSQARRAAEIFERDGAPGVASFLNSVEADFGTIASLYDSEGNLIAGENLPEEAATLARRAAASQRVEFQESGAWMLVARRTRADNQTLVLVGQMVRPGAPPIQPLEILVRLAAVLVTGGLLCYWLARYLTTPAARLREATRLFADGDLSARVGLQLGNRRDELADLGRDFDRMAERIQTLLDSQQRLLRDISHELRSPLARLNVALELVRRNAPAETAPMLDRIGNEANLMNEMIGQLLDISRFEADGDHPAPEMVKLDQLLMRIVEDAEFETAESDKKIRLIVHQTPSLRGWPRQLESAIENVLRNAIYYTPDGGHVDVSLDSSKRTDETVARIIVRDQGPGVPEEHLAAIFRPFHRVGESRDRRSGGVGLGLAIAQRIIDYHGGSIQALNAPQGGLQIEIVLPLGGDGS